MKKALFITIGTRDVVLSKNIDEIPELKSQVGCVENGKEFYSLLSPRIDGQILANRFEDYSPFIFCPIISPSVREIAELEGGDINYIFLVFTDQSRTEGIGEGFVNRDTLYFANIIEKKLKIDFPKQVKEVKKIIVTKEVAFHDNMYAFFGEFFTQNKTIKSLVSENAKVFVLPQGGISSINTSLLLRCAEYFSNTVQFSKPEGYRTPVRSQFPQLFKQNLIKERIRHAIENFEYGIVPSFNFSPIVSTLAEYAFRRITFNFFQARKVLFNYQDTVERAYTSKIMSHTKELEEVEVLRFREWYLVCKIYNYQNKYSDFLLRVFNLAENILKPYAEEKLGGAILFNASNDHQEWKDLINRQPQKLQDYFKKYVLGNGSQLRIGCPSRYAYKAIFDFYSDESERLAFDNNIYFGLEALSSLRNKVGHNLVGVSKEDVELALNLKGINIETFIQNLDAHFNLNGFGFYDEINEVIKHHLL